MRNYSKSSQNLQTQCFFNKVSFTKGSLKHAKPIILALIPLLFVGLAQDAFALNFTPAISYFNLGWALQDMKEGFLGIFSVDAVKKAKLEHIAEIQQHIEEKQKQGLPVTEDEYRRVESKLAQAESIEGKQDILIDGAIKSYKLIKDGNEIRKCVYEFQQGTITNEELEQRCNKLDIVKDECPNGISVAALRVQNENAYEQLQKQCPILANYDSERAFTILKDLK